jgi:hypothetical protein
MNKALGILAFLILIAATFLTVSYHPITQKINEWQADMMGDNKYFPALTIFTLALPPLLLLLGVKKILSSRLKK